MELFVLPDECLTMTYWRNLLKFTVVIILMATLFLSVSFVYAVVEYTRQSLQPERTAAQRTLGELATTLPYEKVEFETSDGLMLRGWYFPSQNGAAVILGQGYATQEAAMLPEAEILAENGYGVLLFFWRRSGASEGDKVTYGDDERRDLTAAIDFVAAQPEVNPEKIGAIGFSMGAVVVTLVAAENPMLKAVVIEAPYPSLEAMLKHRVKFMGRVTQPIIRWTLENEGVDVEAIQPANVICQISPRPVLLIFGSLDEMPPPTTRQILENAACEPKQVWVIDGAEHGAYSEVAPTEYAARLLAFFNEHLNY